MPVEDVMVVVAYALGVEADRKDIGEAGACAQMEKRGGDDLAAAMVLFPRPIYFFAEAFGSLGICF